MKIIDNLKNTNSWTFAFAWILGVAIIVGATTTYLDYNDKHLFDFNSGECERAGGETQWSGLTGLTSTCIPDPFPDE